MEKQTRRFKIDFEFNLTCEGDIIKLKEDLYALNEQLEQLNQLIINELPFMELLDKIRKISPSASIENGVLKLKTVTGDEFVAISNIWDRDIDAECVIGVLNLDTTGKLVNIRKEGVKGRITGDLHNVNFV